MDNKVFQNLTYGMYIISTKFEGEKVGCIVNTVTQITSQNPIISVSINKENYTNKVIKKSNKFAVSILSEQTNNNVISKFGFSSSENVDKFEEFNYEIIEEIPIIKENICGYLICEVIQIIDNETHDVFFARVIDTKKEKDYKSMTYSYYHEVIKGSAPPKAPTYIKEDKNVMEINTTIETEEIYVCTVCGYIHKGPLPKIFKCPECGADRSKFIRKI